MKRFMVFVLIMVMAVFCGACNKNKSEQEAQPQAVDEKTDAKPQAAELPRLMPNMAAAKNEAPKPRGEYQPLKPFIAGELPFIGDAEIPKEQCPQMYTHEIPGFKREDINYEGKDKMKIRTVLSRYTGLKDASVVLEADSMCMPLAGKMARCTNPDENCGDDLQMSGFFLRMFISENEGDMVQDALKYGFKRRNFVCHPEKKGEKGRGMSAWYSDDYKGNGVAMASVRRTDGWYLASCHSGKASETRLLSCLCKNLP